MSVKFSVAIGAKPPKIWAALTKPLFMAQWMGEPEMKLEVQTNWEIASPIYIRGFHHVKFENKGVVLQYINERRLSYSHLSSASRLADDIENYSILDFNLSPTQNQTILSLEVSNFPTETIQNHLMFYWRGTMHKIKAYVESHSD